MCRLSGILMATDAADIALDDGVQTLAMNNDVPQTTRLRELTMPAGSPGFNAPIELGKGFPAGARVLQGA